MFQPHFLHFCIDKAAISLKDKAPKSPQQRFSRLRATIAVVYSLPLSRFIAERQMLLQKCCIFVSDIISI